MSLINNITSCKQHKVIKIQFLLYINIFLHPENKSVKVKLELCKKKHAILIKVKRDVSLIKQK